MVTAADGVCTHFRLVPLVVGLVAAVVGEGFTAAAAALLSGVDADDGVGGGGKSRGWCRVETIVS